MTIDRPCWCGALHAESLGSFDLPAFGSFALVRCTGCGVFALDPPPSVEQLRIAYASDYYGSSNRKFVRPIAGVISFFQAGRARLASRHLPRAGRVLDVGCGNGGFLLQMQCRGFRVEGTEWTVQSAARVPVGAGIKVHIGDLLDLNLPAASFDLVTLWHVFEHLRQPRATLDEIHRLLTPGGTLLMSMPNAESRQAETFGTQWFHHDPPRHLFGFGPRSLERLLDLAGFELKSLNTFSLEQNPFGWIQSWLNARDFPRDRLYALLKGRSRARVATKIVDLLWLAALAAPALVLSTIESIEGRGATMTIMAQRRGPA